MGFGFVLVYSCVESWRLSFLFFCSKPLDLKQWILKQCIMKIFSSKYTFIQSRNQEVSSIFVPSIIILVFWFVITREISFLFAGLAILSVIPYFRGLGNIRVDKEMDDLNLFADGKLEIQGKVTNVYAGWSYRFMPPMPSVLSAAFPFMYPFFQRRRSSRFSNSPTNTIVINMIFELENKERVVIHQQLPPWREMPKGWAYVGNDIKNCEHFFKVRSGVRRLQRKLVG